MLLRCLESGRFALSEGPPLTAPELAARLRTTLAAQGSPADLHLLLPAARCLVTTLPVAKHEVRLLAKTLPWTLEERLLEPAEQMHVAHGPVVNGLAPATAINAAWLQQVLAALAAAGLKAQAASSELLLLPWQAGHWSVFIPTDAGAPVLVRHGAHAGFACARANLRTALQLLLNESHEAPRQLVLITEAAAAVDTSVVVPVLLQSRLALQRQSFAQLLHTPPLLACNFLQGRFAPPLPLAAWWRQWRLAAALLAGLLVTDLALSGYESVRLQREAERSEAELLSLYRSVQPDGLIVDPRLQLEQALAALGGGQTGLLSLLTRMAPALQAAPDALVQNLEYDSSSGEVQVQILTADFAAAENLRSRLQQLGLQAELLGSSSDGAGSRTRLRVGA